MNTSSGENLISAIPEKNPLLMIPVITRILELLPLRDIKRVRLINREWNFLAEPVLRKKAKILFTPEFQPLDFFEYYLDSRLSALPFTAFKFTDQWDGSLVTDLDCFFCKYGKNIKSLELEPINIVKDEDNWEKPLNINHWIESLSDNMDKLTIYVHPNSTCLVFDLENLARVKSLSLFGCDVIVNSSNINRIAPSEISLSDVQFLNQSEEKLTNVVVNDFVDFSNCSKIYLYQRRYTAMTFDMSKDIVHAKQVNFSDIQVLNSEFSEMKTDFLSVWKNPSEAIKMEMKELHIGECSSVNLTYLPQTIEKLTIKRSFCVPEITGPLDLPNLQYLHLEEPIGSEYEGFCRSFEMVSWFKNCSNLVDVHLEGFGTKTLLNVAWLPRSVKRLKLTDFADILFLGVLDPQPIHVEVLSLDFFINSLAVERITKKIIPKILVKTVSFDTDYSWIGKGEAKDFISFVRKNTQVEKIVIETLHVIEYARSPGKNRFLRFVGEKSLCWLYYEFSNQIGNAISEEEFEKYDINCMKSAE